MVQSTTKLAHFLFELGTLRKIARSHRQNLLTDDLSDNISSHSFRVTSIGWFLAKLEHADLYTVVMMCLFHDLAESRTGDQNWIHKKFVKSFDSEAHIEQYSHLVGESDLLKFSTDYEKRQSLEAKISKDADLLDQILLLKEYEWCGNLEAKRWLKDNIQVKKLFSKSAKLLAKEIMTQNPSDWWSHTGWSSDRR